MANVLSRIEMEERVMLCCVWLVKPGEGVLRAKFEKTLSLHNFPVSIEAGGLAQVSGPSFCELVVGERIVYTRG